jgi:myosin-1
LQSYIGNVVLSVNPFRNLPIYDADSVAKYRGRSAFDPKLPPHMCALSSAFAQQLTSRLFLPVLPWPTTFLAT